METLSALQDRFEAWTVPSQDQEPLIRPKSAPVVRRGQAGGSSSSSAAATAGGSSAGRPGTAGAARTGAVQGPGEEEDSSDDDLESPRARLRTKALTTARQHPEVTKLRDALDSLVADIEHDGGVTAGWNKEDHEAFMKLFSRYKSFENPLFYEAVGHIRMRRF